jgi:hypothetical protein
VAAGADRLGSWRTLEAAPGGRTRHDGGVRDSEPDRATEPGSEPGPGTGAGDGTGAGETGAVEAVAAETGAAAFQRLADRICDAVLELAPQDAPAGTRASRSGRLADLSADGVAHAEEVLSDALAALDAVDETVLGVGDVVDLEILRVWVARRQWEQMDRRHENDPLVHLPQRLLPVPAAGPAAGPGVDAAETAGALIRCAAARLAALPAHLALAREVLTGMNPLAVDAAEVRARRLAAALPADLVSLASLLATPPDLSELTAGAVRALAEHADWLAAARPGADADPRLGAQRYGALLWYDLDVELDPAALLVRAESDLLAVEEELAELAGLLGAAPGQDGVRDLLRDVAADPGARPDPATVQARVLAALAEVEREVRALDLVTVPDGPVEATGCPDGDAIVDTPTVASVGGALRRVVAAHVGVPGHGVQATHAARAALPTPARLLAPSVLFEEGWAVHAEGLLTLSDAGTPAQRARRRVAHLALQLRRAARCVVDVRCHVHAMTAAHAAAVLVERAHLGPAAAADEVTAILVHPVRGSVGYVGDHLVGDVVSRLGAVRPDDGARAVHDRVLAHGAVPPRHLAVLLGLPAESADRH